MIKTNLFLVAAAPLLLIACATGMSSNNFTSHNSITNRKNSISYHKVTFDFNGGSYNGSTEQTTYENVKDTSYWKYVQDRLTEEGTITPPTTHQTFVGFSLAEDDPITILDSYVVTRDITVYAQYEAKEGEYCTVNWVDEDVPISTEKYFEGDTPSFKGTEPSHEGKHFDGWDGIRQIEQKDLGGVVNINAIYSAATYSVTLDYNDGSTQPSHTQIVSSGEYVVEPKISRAGYKLTKWIYTSGGSGDFDFNTPITTFNVAIKAIWEEALYTVTWLDYNGKILKTENVAEGNVPSYGEVPTRESDVFYDYAFSRWLPEPTEIYSNQTYVATYEITHFYEDTKAYMHVSIGDNKNFAFTCAATSPTITVDWGDEEPTESVDPSSTISHSYTTAGEYDIRIFNPISTISVSSASALLIEELYLSKYTTTIGASAFQNCTNLKTVTFANESQLESIGNNAFNGCSSLASITIPSGVTSIGAGAFQNCSTLVSINIPSEVVTIGNNTFNGCSSLAFITIPSGVTSIGDDAFKGCSKLITITFEDESQLESIGNNAFEGCSLLASITIPSGVISIGESAFQNCSSFYSVIVPNGTTLLGEKAFDGCSSLTSLTIPSLFNQPLKYYFDGENVPTSLKTITLTNCNEIPEGAFDGCSSLTSIAIPSGVTSIGASAFQDCSSLTSFTIPDGVASIDHDTFNGCSSLTSIIIPSGVTSIGANAFGGCLELATITFEDESQLESIGSNAFDGCSSLTSITIPSTVTSLNIGAFASCSSLTSLTIPSLFNQPLKYYFDGENVPTSLKTITLTNCNEIPEGAFDGCSSLTSITIPSTVTSLNIGAFASCSSLTSLTIPSLFNQPLKYYFNGESAPSSLSTINLTNCDAIPNSAFQNRSSITSITIPDGVKSIGASAFQNCSSLASFTIPDGVTSIGANAFNGCSSLASVNIPSGVKTIETSTFFSCSSLTSIIIPSTVTSIGITAFQNCGKLETVTFEDGSQLKTISNNAFYTCQALKNITIPDGVTSINNGAFRLCKSLESINIPSSVTSIGANAFANDEMLKRVDLTAFTTTSSIPSLDTTAFDGCSSELLFEVDGDDMITVFTTSEKGWPTDPNQYISIS